MTYMAVGTPVGTTPAITETDTVQRFPAGTRISGNDPALGDGEFVYLKGVASTAVGDAVKYDASGLTTRTVAATRGPVAIAMSANTSTSTWGWYQVYGLAVVTAGTVVAGTPAFSTATGGQLDDAVVAGSKIDGVTFQTANAAGAVTVAGFVVSQAGTITQASYTVGAGKALASLTYPALNGNG